MPLIYDDIMIQALSPYGPDNAFHIRILPRRARGRKHLFDAETFHSMSESITVDAIAIAKQIAWSGIKRERLHQLLPPGGKVKKLNAYGVFGRDRRRGPV